MAFSRDAHRQPRSTRPCSGTPDFIIKNLLKKGELTDLSGLAKYSGKTTLVMHALKAVRTGEVFLGEPTKEARIL